MPTTPDNEEPISDVEDEIGKLYDELAAMAMMDRKPDLDERIDDAWKQLRKLQAQEARRQHEVFEANLAMPMDAGARILGMAEALKMLPTPIGVAIWTIHER